MQAAAMQRGLCRQRWQALLAWGQGGIDKNQAEGGSNSQADRCARRMQVGQAAPRAGRERSWEGARHAAQAQRHKGAGAAGTSCCCFLCCHACAAALGPQTDKDVDEGCGWGVDSRRSKHRRGRQEPDGTEAV